MGNQDLFGEAMSSIGPLDLGFKIDNIGLVAVGSSSFPALVQNFGVMRSERVQTITCFNDFVHVYAYGKSPIQGTISGFTLIADSAGGKTINNLISLYENDLRAFQASSSGSLVKIQMNKGETVRGIVTNFEYAINAERPVLCTFDMTFIAFTGKDTILAASGGSSSSRSSTRRSSPNAQR